MIHWPQIDAELFAFGYRVDRRYPSIGDCPSEIIAILGAAADARHAATTDDEPPTEKTLALIRDRLEQAQRADHLPDCIPIRANLTPTVTIYTRPADGRPD